MKKFYFILVTLFALLGATSMRGQEVTLTIDLNNGTLQNLSNYYATSWVSTSTDPQVTISHTSNMLTTWDDVNLMFYCGATSADASFTITPSSDYLITAVSLDFVGEFYYASYYGLNPEWVRVSLNGEEPVTNTSDEEPVNVSVSDLENSSVSFTIAGNVGYCFVTAQKFTVTLKKRENRDLALEALAEALETYLPYGPEGEEAFTIGTQPGQFDAEAVEAFNAALHAADIDHAEDGSDWTSNMIEQKIADLEAAYNAVIASRVKIVLADGYYRIKAGIRYYATDYILDEGTMEEVPVTTYPDKYLTFNRETDGLQAYWKTPESVDTDCPSLWKVTKVGDYYDIVNMGSDARIDRIFNIRTNVTLSPESQLPMAIDAVATIDGVSYSNIRVAPQDDDAYAYTGYWYLHQSGHKSGEGVEGPIVLWNSSYSVTNGIGGSEWVFEPVSETEAQKAIDVYAETRRHEELLVEYDKLLAEIQEKLDIARENEHTILINDIDQVSCPYTYSSYYPITNLFDDNASTLWYATWDTGESPYIQVALDEPAKADVNLTVKHTNSSDTYTSGSSTYSYSYQITEWQVKGSSTPDAPEDQWETLATLSTPNNNLHEPTVSEAFDTKRYLYLRFYITDHVYPAYNYGTLSEFQLSTDTPSPRAQGPHMGNLITDLEDLIAQQSTLSRENITQAEYDALKKAYEAFLTKFVDPTALRQLLDSYANTSESIVIGTNPGFWPNGSAAAQFKTIYDEAKAYDAKGDLSPEKSAAYVEALSQENDNLMAAANKVKEGKWYNLRFPDESTFDTYGWSKTNFAETTSEGDIFDKLIVPGEWDSDNNYYFESLTAEYLHVGSNIGLVSKNEIIDTDMALYRFVNVGDSAYAIQNKGTGLYVHVSGTSSDYIDLSAHPTLFRTLPIGYGLCALAASNLSTGESQNYINCYRTYSSVLNSTNNTPGSRASIFIEEAADVEADFSVEANLQAYPATYNAYCFPVEIGMEEGMFDATVEGNTVTLFPIQKAGPGRPFIFFAPDVSGQSNSNIASYAFTIGNSIVDKPLAGSTLQGTFDDITVGPSIIYASGYQLLANENESLTISANSAYITPGEDFNADSTIEIVIDYNAEDGIAETMQRMAHTGAIYTIDGRLVNKYGNLNDLSRYGKGIYILNGTKVVVK